MSKYTILLGCLIVMLSWPPLCLADEADLLSVVRAGHRSARQSIHSLSAKVTNKVTNSKQQVFTLTGKYWRSLDVVRIQERQSGGTEDMLLKNGEIRQVGRGAGLRPGQIHYAAARRSATTTLAMCDAWTLMLIDFAGPSGGRYDFDRFLEFAKRPPRVARDRKDGHDCIRVALSVISDTGVEQHVTLWHDVDRNYLVWKRTVAYEKYPDRGEAEILEFTEPQPGVFVPTKCRRQHFRDGEPPSIEEITLSEVQVNKPIPESVFQLPAIPRGTMLDDHIRRTRYPVDTGWQPIGRETPLPQLSAPNKSDSAETEYHSPSTTEPIPLNWWLVPGSILVLVIACACLLYRRYRSRDSLRRVG